MTELPSCIQNGERARLFPVVADTSRENRLTSIFLALLPQIPALAETLLETVGVRVTKRTKIETWTEVVPTGAENLDKRPDGLIVVHTAKGTWTALVEAKTKNNLLKEEQITKYVEAAKNAGIDAVITISNQFVTSSDISPVHIPKLLLRKVGLYHWPWMSVQTRCELLMYQKQVEDTEQSFLLREFLRLLNHKDTGIETFTSMNKGWRDVVVAVGNQCKLKKTSPDVEESVQAWLQEERDMCLLLSRHVGHQCNISMERRHKADPVARLKDTVHKLVEDQKLCCAFEIPDCAAELEITADLTRRTITYGMRLKAPLDRKSTKARVNWVLKMLPEEHPKLYVRAHWPGRAVHTQEPIALLRQNPIALQTDNPETVPHSFEILMIDDLAGDFSGTRKFLERLEQGVLAFYDLVGQNLRVWQATPPKPVRASLPDTEELAQPHVQAVTIDNADATEGSTEHGLAN